MLETPLSGPESIDARVRRLGGAFGNSYGLLPPQFATRVDPTAVAQPRLIKFNRALAAELLLDVEGLDDAALAAVFSGNRVLPGTQPIAMAYAGHQFGQFVPQLGDGRALLLGDVRDRFGKRRDIQLKGAGRTPYSRSGDGRAVLGPVLREYLVSEAMHALGISATRALAAVATGEAVFREGRVPGAILTRVAASHVRVGTFQYFAARGDVEATRRLADFAIERHHPEAGTAANPYLELLRFVVRRQARLIAGWMNVGFIHGVMNTDNMTISGETIDYGPCAFMEAYDPETVFSSIDSWGRYAYGNQPAIAGWNLARFAETLLPLFSADQDEAIALAEQSFDVFRAQYETTWLSGMRAKLGLSAAVEAEVAASLIGDLLVLLHEQHVDYTSFFRQLSRAFAGPDGFEHWISRWRALDPDAALMDRVNPIYIPRNHLVEEALTAATAGDVSALQGPLQSLLDAVTAPYDERPGLDRYASPAPEEFGPYRTFCGT